MIAGQRVVEVGEQLRELLGEVVGCGLAAIPLQGERRELVGAGRAPEPEIDAAGIERRQDRERLRHLERAVVRQHHTAAADADPSGARRDRPDQHLGARAREHRAAVVLGNPVAVVAESVRQARQIERVTQRIGAGRSFRHGRLIEDREMHRRRMVRG